MTHLLVDQLRFARSEFLRGLEGVSAEEAVRRLEPMNCISWIVGHLADQENRYWVRWPQGRDLAPGLHELVGFGRPASTPPLDEMWDAWHMITEAADAFLDTLTSDALEMAFKRNGKPLKENTGTLMLRNIYHYWYHLGESQAIRQLLGHGKLPQYVGDISKAAYRPEK
jgi:hypothetical protein